MSTNLVSLALNYLTPDMIARIASALGLDKAIAGKAVTAMVPALLGSFASVAATPEGARKLSGAISQQSPGILDSLASSIGGAGQQGLVNSGVNALGSLLGTSAVPAVAGALGKYVGIGERESTSLIGLLAPAVMGVLGKEQKSQGLDAAGLSNLLAAQKSNINAALPSGFADALKSTGLPLFSAATPVPPACRQGLVVLAQLGSGSVGRRCDRMVVIRPARHRGRGTVQNDSGSGRRKPDSRRG